MIEDYVITDICTDDTNCVPIPPTFQHTALAPVRDQQSCAACWSFVITDCMYNAFSVAGHPPPEALSAQYLLDCWWMGKDCRNGAAPELVYNLKQVTDIGVPLESFLPYRAKPAKTCVKKGMERRYMIERGTAKNLCNPVPWFLPKKLKTSVIEKNIKRMQLAILDHSIVGTIRVYDELYSWDFDKYPEYRVSYNPGKFIGMHAIELVGWTETSWICRTSWGPEFGIDGLFKVRRGHNEAGIESRASTFTISVAGQLPGPPPSLGLWRKW